MLKLPKCNSYFIWTLYGIVQFVWVLALCKHVRFERRDWSMVQIFLFWLFGEAKHRRLEPGMCGNPSSTHMVRQAQCTWKIFFYQNIWAASHANVLFWKLRHQKGSHFLRLSDSPGVGTSTTVLLGVVKVFVVVHTVHLQAWMVNQPRLWLQKILIIRDACSTVDIFSGCSSGLLVVWQWSSRGIEWYSSGLVVVRPPQLAVCPD